MILTEFHPVLPNRLNPHYDRLLLAFLLRSFSIVYEYCSPGFSLILEVNTLSDSFGHSSLEPLLSPKPKPLKNTTRKSFLMIFVFPSKNCTFLVILCYFFLVEMTFFTLWSHRPIHTHELSSLFISAVFPHKLGVFVTWRRGSLWTLFLFSFLSSSEPKWE